MFIPFDCEALQIIMLEAYDKGHFNDISLKENMSSVSLLEYANDALFFCKWSESNARNLIRILKCFHDASGLIVNLAKSCLYGIGSDPSKVE